MALTERQRVVDSMGRALHKEECDQKPGPEYPTWARLADWAKEDYRKRADKALRVVERKKALKWR